MDKVQKHGTTSSIIRSLYPQYKLLQAQRIGQNKMSNWFNVKVKFNINKHFVTLFKVCLNDIGSN